jgi:glycosyltransferase involved in cell wall biosynthesis
MGLHNEVMNAGKAIVVSDVVGCVPDLLINQQNGKVFEMGNIESLRDALIWAIANSEIAGEKSREIIQTWSFREDIQGIKASMGIF